MNIVGSWVINDDLSDNTDDQVEKAIEAAGGDGGRGFLIGRRFLSRWSTPEHELYDRLSYDDALSMSTLIQRSSLLMKMITFEFSYRWSQEKEHCELF